MKKIWRWLIAAGAVILMAFLVVVHNPLILSNANHKKQIHALIDQAILNRHGSDAYDLVPFASHKILRAKPQKGKMVVYAIGYCGGFYQEDGQIKAIRYALEPIELTLSKANGHYQEESVWMPSHIKINSSMEMIDSGESLEYINKHFPWRARNAEFFAEELLQECAAMAQSYFRLMGDGSRYLLVGEGVMVSLSGSGTDCMLMTENGPQFADYGRYEKNGEQIMVYVDRDVYYFHEHESHLVFDAKQSKSEQYDLSQWHKGIFLNQNEKGYSESVLDSVTGSYLVDVDGDGEDEVCGSILDGGGSMLIVLDGNQIHRAIIWQGRVRFGWNAEGFCAMRRQVNRMVYYDLDLTDQLEISHDGEPVPYESAGIYSSGIDDKASAALGKQVIADRKKGDFTYSTFVLNGTT